MWGLLSIFSIPSSVWTTIKFLFKELIFLSHTFSAGTPIAKTGMTGLALGDHLHFGVLVQGVEVRPEEWMDKRWIHNNIDKVFQEADKIIEGK